MWARKSRPPLWFVSIYLYMIVNGTNFKRSAVCNEMNVQYILYIYIHVRVFLRAHMTSTEIYIAVSLLCILYLLFFFVGFYLRAIIDVCVQKLRSTTLFIILHTGKLVEKLRINTRYNPLFFFFFHERKRNEKRMGETNKKIYDCAEWVWKNVRDRNLVSSI